MTYNNANYVYFVIVYIALTSITLKSHLTENQSHRLDININFLSAEVLYSMPDQNITED